MGLLQNESFATGPFAMGFDMTITDVNGGVRLSFAARLCFYKIDNDLPIYQKGFLQKRENML